MQSERLGNDCVVFDIIQQALIKFSQFFSQKKKKKGWKLIDVLSGAFQDVISSAPKSVDY